MESIWDIKWLDITDALPAFTTIVSMPFTHNIAYGEGEVKIRGTGGGGGRWGEHPQGSGGFSVLGWGGGSAWG